MKTLDDISKEDLRELLHKGWMTHDAMWFLHCLEECGIEKTNEINLAAIRSMAQIEAKRVQKALGVEKIENFKQVQEFAEDVFGVLMPKFMKYRLSCPEPDVLRGEWEPGQCFAYQGMKKLGMIDKYKCGIFTRVESWFDTLGLRYGISPKFEECIMHTRGSCHRDYRFFFGPENPDGSILK